MAKGGSKRKSWFRRLARDQKGSVMMEYIVIGLLIAAVSIAAVRMFGTNISNMFGVLTTAVVNPNGIGEKVSGLQNLDAQEAVVDQHIQDVTGGSASGD